MKRIKFTLMTLAIGAAVCSAFVTKQDPDCSGAPQYYYQGGVYYPAGTMGDTYDCDFGSGASTCTYYKPDPAGHPYDYALCQYGDYLVIGIAKDQAKK